MGLQNLHRQVFLIFFNILKKKESKFQVKRTKGTTRTPYTHGSTRKERPTKMLPQFALLLLATVANQCVVVAAATCNDANCDVCSAADTCTTCDSAYHGADFDPAILIV